jgi:hypothetical protein
VFNFVRATFVDGEDFVSDAPESIAIAVDRALSALPRMSAELEGGTLSRGDEGGWLVYLRGGPDATTSARTPFVHAVVLVPGEHGEMPDSTASVEQRLRDRYGPSPQARVRELVGQLAALPVAHGARILTELFLESEGKGEMPAVREEGPPPQDPRERRQRRGARARWPVAVRRGRDAHRPPSPHPGWLVATFAAAAAGFFGALSWERGALDSLAGPASAPAVVPPAVSAAPAPPVAAPVPRESARMEPERTARVPEAPPARRAAAAAPPFDVALPMRLPPARVSASALWVRSGPGPEHRRTERLVEGTRVDPAGPNQDGWTPIAAPVQGWVASRFLAPVQEAAAGSGPDRSSP